MNSRHNWDSYSHQTLYDRIHGSGGFFLPDGAGVSGASGAQDGWAELAGLMAGARDRTEAALAKAGAVWEGGAADAMRSGVTPLAQWADDAHTASAASQASTDTHVSAYSAAKNQMPEPVPVTSTANGDYGGIPAGFTHLFGGQTDQDKQEAAAQEAKAEAVRVMSVYDVESGAARLTAGRFVPPPSVAVEVASAQGSGRDVVPVGVVERPHVRQGGDDRERPASDVHRPVDTPVPPGGVGAVPGGTAPSVAGSVSPSVVGPAASGVEQQRPSSFGLPGVGVPGIAGPGREGAAPGGAAPGRAGPGGAGPGRAGSGGAAPGAGGGRGVGAGSGLVAEGRAGATGARGASGMGMGPAGNRAEGDDDKEHKTAEYLRGPGDSFWDDSPPVAPAVIGDEDDG